jgi:hypothetical protein
MPSGVFEKERNCLLCGQQWCGKAGKKDDGKQYLLHGTVSGASGKVQSLMLSNAIIIALLVCPLRIFAAGPLIGENRSFLHER